MASRTKWLGLTVSTLVILSMALLNLSGAMAAAPSRHAHAGKSSTPPACKTRNKASGVIKFSDWQFPDTLNPAQYSTVVDLEVINSMIDGLFYYNNKLQLKPQMATSVPTLKNKGITNGGKTYTIHIKPGLKWSNGTVITSQDFKFDWQIGMNKASGPYCSGSCDVISRIDTPGKYTIVFHLKQPAAAFLSTDLPPGPYPLSWPGGWTSGDVNGAANKLYQDSSFNYEGTNYPTNGPYQVTSFVNNDRVVLQPMKYYNDMTCGGYAKQLLFVFYSSKPDLEAAAASGGTDVTQDYTPADLPQLQGHASAYKLVNIPGVEFEHLELNTDSTYNGKPNPLASANVRIALALALDKLGLIRSALGLSASQARSLEAWTFMVATKKLTVPYADKKLTGQWDPVAHKYQANTGSGQALADAKKLLSHTQWKNGFTLDFDTTSGNPVRAAQEAVVAASWARIGVKVNPGFIPASKFFSSVWSQDGTIQHGAFQVAQFAEASSTPDPDGFKYLLQSKYVDRNQTVHAAINQNYAGIHDALIDREMNVGSASLNKSVRTRAYTAVQVEVNKMAYWIPLFYRPSIVTGDRHVQNFSDSPLSFGPEWNTFAWHFVQ